MCRLDHVFYFRIRFQETICDVVPIFLQNQDNCYVYSLLIHFLVTNIAREMINTPGFVQCTENCKIKHDTLHLTQLKFKHFPLICHNTRCDKFNYRGIFQILHCVNILKLLTRQLIKFCCIAIKKMH